MLTLQSTHNTWTKKHSLSLYWGNVLLGIVTSLVYTSFNIMEDDVELSWSFYLSVVVAIVTTVVGIVLLFTECKNKK